MEHEKHRVDFSTGEIALVNTNFLQLYIDNMDLIGVMIGENPTAARVFTWLLKHMDNKNALIVSQQALSESLSVTRQTIYNSITYLKEKKAIAVFKSGNTNIYAVNAQIAWKSDAIGKRYALFDAKIFILELEQEKNLPLYNTELIGISVKKKVKKKANIEINSKKSIDNFEKDKSN